MSKGASCWSWRLRDLGAAALAAPLAAPRAVNDAVGPVTRKAVGLRIFR